MPSKNIFVIGLNEFNLEKLRNIRGAEDYVYHSLLRPADVLERDHYPMDEILGQAQRELEAFDGSVDGIIHYIDFPASTIVPILCGRFGLPSASLEAVLKCEHKYWSRIEQQRSVPEHVPRFAAFDPFDDDALSKIGIGYPFWIKPIKSFSSYLGFRIDSAEEFRRHVETIRRRIGRFREAFDYLLDRVELPPEVVGVGGGRCIAEELVDGHQCTLECYVDRGETRLHGAVDSIRETNRTSFARYQYPSRLPGPVQNRMLEIARRFAAQIGYDNAPFNIEFFWDPDEDHIRLLEVNPRISESHCDLFEKVDGVSSHEIAVDLALGRKPRPAARAGPFPMAAKFFLRRYADGVVRRSPDAATVRQVEREVPGARIVLLVSEGTRLSDLKDQDSYTYLLAKVWIGGRDEGELLERYRQCVAALDFEFEDAPVVQEPVAH